MKGNPVRAFDPFGLYKASKHKDPTENTIVCRNQKPAVQIGNDVPDYVKKCIGECEVLVHEQSHLADVLASSPDVCKGKPDGVFVIGDTPQQTFASERRAFRATIDCLLKRQATNTDCSCESIIEYYKTDAIDQLKQYSKKNPYAP